MKLTSKQFYISGAIVTLFLAGFVSFYASSHPDGLEKVAGKIGFLDTAKEPATAGSALAGYSVKGVENARISGGIAGVLGVAATGVVATGIFYFLGKRKRK